MNFISNEDSIINVAIISIQSKESKKDDPSKKKKIKKSEDERMCYRLEKYIG